MHSGRSCKQLRRMWLVFLRRLVSSFVPPSRLAVVPKGVFELIRVLQNSFSTLMFSVLNFFSKMWPCMLPISLQAPKTCREELLLKSVQAHPVPTCPCFSRAQVHSRGGQQARGVVHAHQCGQPTKRPGVRHPHCSSSPAGPVRPPRRGPGRPHPAQGSGPPSHSAGYRGTAGPL